MSPLHVQLNRVRKRIWAQIGVSRVSSALLWTASLACVWLVLCRLFPVLPYTLEGAALITGLGLAAALWLTWRERPDIRTAALACLQHPRTWSVAEWSSVKMGPQPPIL